MTVLAEIAVAAGPSLAPYAVPEPGPERFDGALGDRLFVLEAVYEGYLLHYGPRRGGGAALGRLGTRSRVRCAIGSPPPRPGVPIVPLGTMLALVLSAPQNHSHTRG